MCHGTHTIPALREVSGHVTFEWVMSHLKESCHTWMSHVTSGWVLSYFNEWQQMWSFDEWFASLMIEAWHIWMGHVAYHEPHTATHCNTLQYTVTLPHFATLCNTWVMSHVMCNTLQHSATHCNRLQQTATDGSYHKSSHRYNTGTPVSRQPPPTSSKITIVVGRFFWPLLWDSHFPLPTIRLFFFNV